MNDHIALIALAVVIACWFGFAGIFIFRKKPPAAAEHKREPIFVTDIALQSLGFAAIWMFQRPLGTPMAAIPKGLEVMLAVITIALAIGSVWLVTAAVRMLGKQWAVAARITDEHQLITSGPYHLVRHPIYSGMFGLLLATGLAFSQAFILVPAIVLYLAGTLIRARSEERLLRETFGAEFDAYRRSVPALIPWVY